MSMQLENYENNTINSAEAKQLKKTSTVYCNDKITHLRTGLLGGALCHSTGGALQQREGDAIQLEHLLAEDVRGGGGHGGALHQGRLVG